MKIEVSEYVSSYCIHRSAHLLICGAYKDLEDCVYWKERFVIAVGNGRSG